jgi:hypothetical protein
MVRDVFKERCRGILAPLMARDVSKERCRGTHAPLMVRDVSKRGAEGQMALFYLLAFIELLRTVTNLRKNHTTFEDIFMCFTQAPSQVNVNSNLCSEMDIVL